jgi:hypothetical protein
MRKLTLVVAMVVMAIPFFAGVALAADQIIQCKSVPCYGSGGNDKIVMRGGSDLVLANGYGNDTDIVKGGRPYDKINVADGDKYDKASGGFGGDWCIVDAKKEALMGCSRVTVR